MERLLSSALVFLLVVQCALSMVIPEERNKREATENEEVQMVAGMTLSKTERIIATDLRFHIVNDQ